MKNILQRGAAILAMAAALAAKPAAANAQQFAFNRNIGVSGYGAGKFLLPNGVAVDSAGTVYIAGGAIGSIVEYSAANIYLKTLVTQTNGPFNGIAVDLLGNVYTVEAGFPDEYSSAGNRVQAFKIGSGGQVSSVGVALSGAGHVFFSDQNNNGVGEYTTTGAYLGYLAGPGAPVPIGAPWGVAVDGAENLYVADYANGRVALYNSGGTFVRYVGSAGSGNGQMTKPTGVALDKNGNLFVGDSGNNRVAEFDRFGAWVQNIGSAGTGPGQFNNISALCFDGAGNLYVADHKNNTVAEFSPNSVSGTVTLLDCSDAAQNLVFTFRPAGGGTPFTRRQVLTPTGTNTGAFAFTDIPFGTYDIAIKGHSWLQVTTPGVVFSPAAPFAPLRVTLSNGDLNNDNVVDTSDFNILAGAFGNAGDL